MAFLPKLKVVSKVYEGSHVLSRWVRYVLDRYGIHKVKKWFGYHLATATFFAAVIPVSSSSGLVATPVPVVPEPVVAAMDVKTETTLAWPVSGPSITQGYRYGHPGIDIQGAPPIFPVDNGTITDVIFAKWGYGNHVYVQHANGRQSLYAHLSKVNVVKGQEVTRDTILGIMGRTGFATGIHLHLEIYQDGKTMNPLSILPTK
jgi:murein DD-endopeptidase MepM/ murein hydrolase activator NlpD